MQSLIEALVLEDSSLAEYSCESWPQEEEIPMTLQLALLGTDGLVFASDKKGTFSKDRVRTSSTTTKLFWDRTNGIVCAASGDDLAAQVAAELINLEIQDDLPEDAVYKLLQDKADKVAGTSPKETQWRAFS